MGDFSSRRNRAIKIPEILDRLESHIAFHESLKDVLPPDALADVTGPLRRMIRELNHRQQLAQQFETLGLTEYASRDDVELKFVDLMELFDPEQFHDYPARYAQMAKEDRRNVEQAHTAISGLLGGGKPPSFSSGLTEVLTEEAVRVSGKPHRVKPKPPKHL